MENRRRLRHVRLGVLTLFENIVPVTTALPCEIVFRRFIEKLLPDILANKGLVPDVRECLVCYRESQSYSGGPTTLAIQSLGESSLFELKKRLGLIEFDFEIVLVLLDIYLTA